MKITGDNTRMIEVAPGEWAEVRGTVIDVTISHHDACAIRGIDDCSLNRLIGLQGKRVLILELVE